MGSHDRPRQQLASAGYLLAPEYRPAKIERGAVLMGLERFEETAAQFAEVVRIEPGHADLRSRLGDALMTAGRLTEASAQHAELVRLRPNDPQAREKLERCGAGMRP